MLRLLVSDHGPCARDNHEIALAPPHDGQVDGSAFFAEQRIRKHCEAHTLARSTPDRVHHVLPRGWSRVNGQIKAFIVRISRFVFG